MDVRKCEAPDCGMKLPPYVPRIRREEDGLLVCPNCIEGRPGRPRAHSVKLAHDSGDGKTIYHCPFCGAGQVVGGSDGTTECQFCHTFFTVQVQPEFADMPQTIDGQPVQMPGMPGDPTQPSPSPDGPTAGGDDKNAPFQPPDQPDAFQPPDQPTQPAGDKPNPFQAAKVRTEPSHKKMDDDALYKHLKGHGWENHGMYFPTRSVMVRKHNEQHGGNVTSHSKGHVHEAKVDRRYLVAEGVAIPEDSYVRRLALEHAVDRDAVLADLRGGR